MTIQSKFGEIVRHEREKRSWSQDRLADVTGLHRTYISGIERGVRNPTLTIVERIAMGLRMRVSELFEGMDVQK